MALAWCTTFSREKVRHWKLDGCRLPPSVGTSEGEKVNMVGGGRLVDSELNLDFGDSCGRVEALGASTRA
jgi:hypothetical protein